MSLTPDDMLGSFAEIISKFGEMAEEFAEAQSKKMFATIQEAAESVGNVVDAEGKFTKETYLEARRKIQMDFDPRTGAPRHPTMVLHPTTLEKIRPDVEKWGEDPAFLAELAAIEQEQRLAWRAREARRRLVD